MPRLPPRLSARGAVQRRLFALVCVLVAWVAPTSAWAMAPMCDDLAQSIEAPLFVWDTEHGEMRAVQGCDPIIQRADGAPAPDRERSTPSLSDGLDRALPPLFALPQPTRSTPVPAPPAQVFGERAAVSRGVFRPPCVEGAAAGAVCGV